LLNVVVYCLLVIGGNLNGTLYGIHSCDGVWGGKDAEEVYKDACGGEDSFPFPSRDGSPFRLEIHYVRRERGEKLVMADEPASAWEWQPSESRPAYQAFSLYRDMPPDQRSYTAVAQGLAKSRTLISRWGAKWNWQERTAAFDEHNDRQRLAANQVARYAALQNRRRSRPA
jgi:hypothetical protein